jgi:hypothetical protein
MKTTTLLKAILPLIVTFFAAQPVQADGSEPPPNGGQVQISLAEYSRLLEISRQPENRPESGYATGNATMTLQIRQSGSTTIADADLTVPIRVLESKWTTIPVLPPGLAVQSVDADGSPIELVSDPRGLCWTTNAAGQHNLQVRFKIEALKTEQGYFLNLPLANATSTNLSIKFADRANDLSISPTVSVETNYRDGGTVASATLPATNFAQVKWRGSTQQGYSLSRATYSGKLEKDALVWNGELQVELFGESSLPLALLPISTTLRDIRIDGKPAAILVENDFFATRVSGAGSHKVQLSFNTAIGDENGQAGSILPILKVPVSQIEIELPGRKQLVVSPGSNVTHTFSDQTTIAAALVPMSERVALSWSEAVPEEENHEVRINAAVYHLFHAEEGLLVGHAFVNYEMTKGETGVLELQIAPDVEINRLVSDEGLINDWRISQDHSSNQRTLSVFLSRNMKANTTLEVFFDRSLTSNQHTAIPIPLIRTIGTQRQRGMIALMASKDISLKPIEESGLTRVGENQFPAALRNTTKLALAHTFKYSDTPASLSVEPVTPEPVQGRFDAQINTLISLGDVSMKGSASIDLNVKSGALNRVQLDLPENINILNLTAPSLRVFKAIEEGGRHYVDVQFTQDMDGQFRIEVSYELLMNENSGDAKVPTLAVRDADVEQGRIAVEALSVVEVQTSSTSSLVSLDPSELPQQLVLKTTNPILLAFKYARADQPHDLTLRITRHKEIEVPSAAIEQANYSTLMTRDGVAVTRAEFSVKNIRNQFLRVRLPENSVVWSVTVNGNPEKPALAEESGKGTPGNEILIKIINSSQGFPVVLVYQTPSSNIRGIGQVSATLPRPDMIVSHTRWQITLPDDASYGTLRSNMDIVENGVRVSQISLGSDVVPPEKSTLQFQSEAFPTGGVRFTLAKLYANQDGEDPYVRLTYTTGLGARIVDSMVALASILMFGGLCLAYQGKRRSGIAVSSAGILVFLFARCFLNASLLWFYLILGLGAFGVSLAVAMSPVPRSE